MARVCEVRRYVDVFPQKAPFINIDHSSSVGLWSSGTLYSEIPSSTFGMCWSGIPTIHVTSVPDLTNALVADCNQILTAMFLKLV